MLTLHVLACIVISLSNRRVHTEQCLRNHKTLENTKRNVKPIRVIHLLSHHPSPFAHLFWFAFKCITALDFISSIWMQSLHQTATTLFPSVS